MSFISNDEYVLLMDYGNRNPTPVDVFRRFADLGVKTAFFNLNWGSIEKKPGVVNYDEVDEHVSRIQEAGLKCLLMVYWQVPDWCPDDWYKGFYTGPCRNHPMFQSQLSWWNREAQNYSDQFIENTVERYNSPTVQCIQGQMLDGEYLMPYNEPAYYDKHAAADFMSRFNDSLPLPDNDHIVKDQRIESWIKQKALEVTLKWQRVFATHPAMDTWTTLHPVLEDWGINVRAGNFVWDTLDMIAREFPDHQMNTIRFTHYPWGNNVARTIQERNKYPHIHNFGGVQFCQNMVGSAQMSSQDRGRILCHPTHIDSGFDIHEDWMFDTFRQAREIMKHWEPN